MMSEFDIKAYLKKLKKTLASKELESFYVMCDRADFKPIKGYDTPREFNDMLQEKKQYYAGKRVADITLNVNLKGLKEDEPVFYIKIVIYKITEEGKMLNKAGHTLGALIGYYPDDLEEKPFKLKHVERLMDLVGDGLLSTDTLFGMKYTDAIKRLKKKGIDLDDDDD
jgi:hypothetical protein